MINEEEKPHGLGYTLYELPRDQMNHQAELNLMEFIWGTWSRRFESLEQAWEKLPEQHRKDLHEFVGKYPPRSGKWDRDPFAPSKEL